MTGDTLDRRTILKRLAVGGAATVLAGCTSAAAPQDGTNDGSGSGDSATVDFGDWFDDVSNFDGVVDETGSDVVTVAVGAEANGGGYGFGPAAVRVSAGTTVVWEWTGAGGRHNVVDEDGAFESEIASDEGHSFSHTFDDSGTFTYACTPHQVMGMKGAVVVG